MGTFIDVIASGPICYCDALSCTAVQQHVENVFRYRAWGMLVLTILMCDFIAAVTTLNAGWQTNLTL